MYEDIPEDAQLMINLMNAMHSSTTATVDSLWRGAVREERWNEATFLVMRETVIGLLEGPYLPHPYMIEKALYPTGPEIREKLVDMYGPDWENPTSERSRF